MNFPVRFALLLFTMFVLILCKTWVSPGFAQTGASLTLDVHKTISIPGEAVSSLSAITYGHDGSLFAIDAQNNQLLHFSQNGDLLGQTGGFGFGDNSFQSANDLTSVGFEIWVADELGDRILRFDQWLAPVGRLFTNRDAYDDSDFERPLSVARSPNGDIMLIDGNRMDVLLLDPSGRFLERLAGYGDHTGGLMSPDRVEVSAMGTLAVADNGKHSVLLFDSYGTFIREIPIQTVNQANIRIAWSNNFLFVSSGTSITAYTAASIQPLQSWEGISENTINDLAGKQGILAITSGRTIQLFRVQESATR